MAAAIAHRSLIKTRPGEEVDPEKEKQLQQQTLANKQAIKNLTIGKYYSYEGGDYLYLGPTNEYASKLVFYDLNFVTPQTAAKLFNTSNISSLGSGCSEEIFEKILTSKEFGYMKKTVGEVKADPKLLKYSIYSISNNGGNLSAINPNIRSVSDDSIVFIRPKQGIMSRYLSRSLLSASDVNNCVVKIKYPFSKLRNYYDANLGRLVAWWMGGRNRRTRRVSTHIRKIKNKNTTSRRKQKKSVKKIYKK